MVSPERSKHRPVRENVAIVVGRICRAQVIRHVVGQLALADVIAVPRAGEPIAARLHGDAEHRAAGECARVRARAADLELFEAAEVEVAGVGGGAFGGVDALDARLVLRVEAIRPEARLVTRVRAADVERVIWMPGACAMAAQTSRAFGISVSSSFVKLVPIEVVEVSTIGESPVTVTVSCNVATFNC